MELQEAETLARLSEGGETFALDTERWGDPCYDVHELLQSIGCDDRIDGFK